MRHLAVILSMFTLSAFAAADSDEGLARTWNVSLQAGFSSTFQLTLGGYFGNGPDVQDRLTTTLNNAVRDGDSLSVFGFSTTDLGVAVPNWQGGAMYKARVLRRGRHTLLLGGGVQRWLLPSVKSGAQDWNVAGSLNYTTRAGNVPVVVTQDSWSILRSPLAKGSLVYTQIYTQHQLLKRNGFRLLLREGPAHTYAWGFWGANGNRVVRYGGTLVAAWPNTTFEAGYRQQFGLQDGIHYNRYWSFMLTRQIGGSLHRAR